jgi:hypothetical protein
MGSSVAGDDQREQQHKLEKYMFQRRVLAVTTLGLGISVILWIVCMSSTLWFSVSSTNKGGIYVPETRRYFKSSHSGIWRTCRYAISPVLMANHEAARNFTTLAVQKNIIQFQRKLSTESYVAEFLHDEVSKPTTYEEIDDNFLRHLFAHWIKSDPEFYELRKQYRELAAKKHFIPKTPSAVVTINPTDLAAIKKYIADTLFNIKIDDVQLNVIVPKQVRAILFKGWEQNPKITGIMAKFASDMGISHSVYGDDETLYEMRPPAPPEKGKYGEGYEYVPYKKCQMNDLFQKDDSSVTKKDVHTDIMMDFIRTSASFAIIGVFIMILGFFFSVYTFLNPRYMFKRLAGGIHFISASTIVVTIQTLQTSISVAEEHVRYTFPTGAVYSYGYAYYLAWFVFAFNVFAFLTFLWYSKKKKGSKAFTDELAMADEEINIGR